MDGDEGREVVDMIEDQGTQAAAEYLAQWDYGEDDNVTSGTPWGSSDYTEEVTAGGTQYTLAWNPGLGYASLQRKAGRTASRRTAGRYVYVEDGHAIEEGDDLGELVRQVVDQGYSEGYITNQDGGRQGLADLMDRYASRITRVQTNAYASLASKVQVGAADRGVLKALASLKGPQDSVGGMDARRIAKHLLAVGQMDGQTRSALTRVASR